MKAKRIALYTFLSVTLVGNIAQAKPASDDQTSVIVGPEMYRLLRSSITDLPWAQNQLLTQQIDDPNAYTVFRSDDQGPGTTSWNFDSRKSIWSLSENEPPLDIQIVSDNNQQLTFVPGRSRFSGRRGLSTDLSEAVFNLHYDGRITENGEYLAAPTHIDGAVGTYKFNVVFRQQGYGVGQRLGFDLVNGGDTDYVIGDGSLAVFTAPRWRPVWPGVYVQRRRVINALGKAGYRQLRDHVRQAQSM